MNILKEDETTKLMKQRAVMDLFKILKSIGLSSYYKKLVPTSLLFVPFPKLDPYK